MLECFVPFLFRDENLKPMMDTLPDPRAKPAADSKKSAEGEGNAFAEGFAKGSARPRPSRATGILMYEGFVVSLDGLCPQLGCL